VKEALKMGGMGVNSASETAPKEWRLP
jgi:hypothetical protein